MVDSFNPFARSHHSDLVSSGGGSAESRSPARSPDSEIRRAFKRSIAHFYGLEARDGNKLIDMLGTERLFCDA